MRIAPAFCVLVCASLVSGPALGQEGPQLRAEPHLAHQQGYTDYQEQGCGHGKEAGPVTQGRQRHLARGDHLILEVGDFKLKRDGP